MHPQSNADDSSPTPSLGARLLYLELDPADREHLAKLAAALLPHLEDVLLDWHEFLNNQPATAGLLGENRGDGHLLEVQLKYFRTLLTVDPDENYLAERSRVGRVHHQVGLGPFWYLGAYRKFLDLVRTRLLDLGHRSETTASWTAALEKMVTLDLALALESYQEREQETLRRSNRELERQMQHAREAASLKKEFLSRISHELRTPLHAMLGFADLVADGIQGPVTTAQQDSLAKVRVHGERLVTMVDQLIEAAKLSAAAPIDPEPFDLAPLLDEASALATDAAALKGLEFASEIQHPLPRVLGDRGATAVALRQLLDNAVRFTTVGTVGLEVTCRHDRIRVAVHDSGPGIPPDQISRIFEPFHQVDGGDQRRCGGIGMGLTLAQDAIRRSGGSLELDQTGPGGSTFTIELPLDPAKPV